jgi:hypothetical protein
MIKFKTKSGQWQIGDLTIETYYRIQSLITLIDLSEVQVQVVSILSGAPESEVREMEAEAFAKVWYQVEVGPLNAATDEAFKRVIEVDGRRYGFIHLQKLTIGELADLDTIKSHPQSEKQLHKIMAILFRPIISEEGTGYEIEMHQTEGFSERADLFLTKLPVLQVLGAIDFFFHITKVSLNSMLDSLTKTLTEMLTSGILPTETIEEILKLHEVGVNSSTSLPTTISSESNHVQNFELTKSLTTWPIEKIKQN